MMLLMTTGSTDLSMACQRFLP